jgi:hypothetical protein
MRQCANAHSNKNFVTTEEERGSRRAASALRAPAAVLLLLLLLVACASLSCASAQRLVVRYAPAQREQARAPRCALACARLLGAIYASGRKSATAPAALRRRRSCSARAELGCHAQVRRALLQSGYVVRMLSPKFPAFVVAYRGGGAQKEAEQEEEHMRRRRLSAAGALATQQAISTLSTLPGVLRVEEDAQVFLTPGRRELLAAEAPPQQQQLLQRALVQEGGRLQPEAVCSYSGPDVPAVSGSGSVEFTPYGLRALQALDPTMLEVSKSLSSKVRMKRWRHSRGRQARPAAPRAAGPTRWRRHLPLARAGCWAAGPAGPSLLWSCGQQGGPAFRRRCWRSHEHGAEQHRRRRLPQILYCIVDTGMDATHPDLPTATTTGCTGTGAGCAAAAWLRPPRGLQLLCCSCLAVTPGTATATAAGAPGRRRVLRPLGLRHGRARHARGGHHRSCAQRPGRHRRGGRGRAPLHLQRWACCWPALQRLPRLLCPAAAAVLGGHRQRRLPGLLAGAPAAEPASPLLPCAAFGRTGMYESELLPAFDNCTAELDRLKAAGYKDMKAVINMSLGRPGGAASLVDEAVNATYARGDVLLVASAGNDGSAGVGGAQRPPPCSHPCPVPPAARTLPCRGPPRRTAPPRGARLTPARPPASPRSSTGPPATQTW